MERSTFSSGLPKAGMMNDDIVPSSKLLFFCALHDLLPYLPHVGFCFHNSG